MRILIATDGSPEADLAVRLGGEIELIAGGPLTLLTIIREVAEQPQAEAILLRATTLLPQTATVQTKIRVGQVADEIVSAGKADNQQLIIIGDKPPHGLLGWFLAPTAEQVMNQMSCPVLLARGAVRPLRRVLVCESGRDPSLLARLIDQLAPLLQQVDELTALHVMSQIAAAPGVPGWELRASADELMEKHTIEGSLLEADMARLAQLNVRINAKVRHGLVVREILDEMQVGDYDLVVIGAHQSKGWERFLLDDLARELIHHADRPLLVV
jgi:nucleotide-binding universal stress UspA family protein